MREISVDPKDRPIDSGRIVGGVALGLANDSVEHIRNGSEIVSTAVNHVGANLIPSFAWLPSHCSMNSSIVRSHHCFSKIITLNIPSSRGTFREFTRRRHQAVQTYETRA